MKVRFLPSLVGFLTEKNSWKIVLFEMQLKSWVRDSSVHEIQTVVGQSLKLLERKDCLPVEDCLMSTELLRILCFPVSD